jgi:hypothetical protein
LAREKLIDDKISILERRAVNFYDRFPREIGELFEGEIAV